MEHFLVISTTSEQNVFPIIPSADRTRTMSSVSPHLLRGDLTRKKHKEELDFARLEMTEKQLRCGWVGWGDITAIDEDYWTEREAECMAWSRSVDRGEEKYWATLAMAAGSIINGNCDEAVKGFLSAVRGFLSNWAETIGTD